MAEPSLSEIASYKGDANLAGGSSTGADIAAPVPLSFDKGLEYLNQASLARADYNKYLSQTYSKNLTDNLANLRSIDFSKALSTDLPMLRQKYADLAKGISDNFDAIRNPASNPEAYAQLANQEAELRGLIAQSENHNGIHSYNRNYLAANPTFNTKENKDKIAAFESAPIDQRKDYLLTTPNNFDVNKLAQMAGNYATQAISKQALSKDKNWILTTEGTDFAKEKYHEATLALLHNTIENGEPLYDKYLADYKLLPDELKKDTSPDDYILGVVDALAPKTALKTTMQANQYGLNRQTEAFAEAQQRRAQAFEADQNEKNRTLQAKLLKKGEIDPNEAGEAKLRTLANVFTTGNLSEQLGQKIYGDNNKITKTVKVISQNEDGSPKIENNKIPVPLVTYKGSSIDGEGNLHIHRFDNATNQMLPDMVRSYNDAYTDMDKMYGDAYAPQIGSATATYSKKNFQKPTPTLEELRSHFNVPNVVIKKYDPTNIPDDLRPPGIVPNDLTGKDPLPGVKDINPKGAVSNEQYQEFLKKVQQIKK